jgi:hypothetical protein
MLQFLGTLFFSVFYLIIDLHDLIIIVFDIFSSQNYVRMYFPTCC